MTAGPAGRGEERFMANKRVTGEKLSKESFANEIPTTCKHFAEAIDRLYTHQLQLENSLQDATGPERSIILIKLAALTKQIATEETLLRDYPQSSATEAAGSTIHNQLHCFCCGDNRQSWHTDTVPSQY
jgi:hypothetical protein